MASTASGSTREDPVFAGLPVGAGWVRSLAEQADDVVAFLDADTRISWVSPGVGDLLGWEPAELVGRLAGDLIHPDDLSALMATHGRAVREGRPPRGGGPEARALRRDGTTTWMSVRIIVLEDGDGGPPRSVMTLRDVDEIVAARERLAASEERYRSIIAALPEDIVIADLDGSMRFVSPAGLAMFGETDVTTVLGRSVLDYLAPEERAAAAVTLASAATGGTTARIETYKGLRADGTTFDIEVNWVTTRDDDGAPTGFAFAIRDVTERGAVARSLDLVRAELVEAQRVAHTGSWTWDSVADEPTWSEGMYAIYGLDRSQPVPVYADAARSYTPDSWERLQAAVANAVATGQSYAVPVDIVRPDGEIRHAVTRGEAIRDAAGAIVGLRGAVVDLTDQKRVEDELRRAKEELEAAQRVSQTGSYTVDLATGLATWSNQLKAIYGLDPDAPAPNADELDALLPGGGRTFRDAVEEAIANRATGEGFEHPYRRPDGSTGWLLTRGNLVFGPRGEPVAIRGTETDVTEIHEAREAIRASAELQRSVFDAISDGLVVQDVEGRITAANPAARRILGLSLDEITRRDSFDPRWAATTEDGEPFPGERHPLSVTLATGEPVRDVLMNLAHPDGRRIWISINSEALCDPQGRRIGAVASFTDVTEKRELARRLQRAQRLEAVGQLAGGVAHDFNNLLAAIRGYTELARDQLPFGHPAGADLAEALLAADRAARLTRELLAFSRRLPLRPAVVDPASIVNQLVPMLRRLLGEQIELRTTAGPGLWPIRVDTGQFEQVIVNLAVNARDAMPDGGLLEISLANVSGLPDVEGATEPGGATGDWVRLAVTDTGAGMDAATLAHVFEPFFTTKPVGEGTGMGLATVYGIVEASGGHIAVISEPGRGATFQVDLPRVTAEPLAVEPERAPAPSGGVERILLVEDEAAVRDVGGRFLGDLGYTVLQASRPDEALALSDEVLATVDLLVTDVVMPGMGGVRLADRLEERRGRPLATVLISGYAPDPALEARLQRPRTRFVAKPYSREALAQAVREALQDG